MEKQITLRVNEIFYSIQGEGQRNGTPNLFIRLAGCSAKMACYSKGIICDTNFEGGKEFTIDELSEKINYEFPNADYIIWTGGEPLDQLTEEVIEHFSHLDYQQAVETSGTKPIPKGLDYVVISPKIAEHALKKIHGEIRINELRYVIHKGQALPSPILDADYLYLSPHNDGNQINMENVKYCINLVKENPDWRISNQMHKIFGLL